MITLRDLVLTTGVACHFLLVISRFHDILCLMVLCHKLKLEETVSALVFG